MNKLPTNRLFDLWRFDRASDGEGIVFGACRPGYPSTSVPEEIVADWIRDMKNAGILRVCCLLADAQLDYYDDLPGSYLRAFGTSNVLFAPVDDYTLAGPALFSESILPFLRTAEDAGEGVVVHCSGGYGRTGHVLAAWLVAGRGFSPRDAIASVKAHGRAPAESLRGDETALARYLAQLMEPCVRADSGLNFTA